MIEEPLASGKSVPALVRTKRILDALSTGGKPKGVSELARLLDLPKSTVHGLCHTLVDLGLMMRVGTSQFAVGAHVLSWANAFEGQSDLTQEFMRIAEATDLISKEAINLSILTGNEVMYVACRRGHRSARRQFPARRAAAGAVHGDGQGDDVDDAAGGGSSASSPAPGRRPGPSAACPTSRLHARARGDAGARLFDR